MATTTTTTTISDRQCLRYHHERLGRILDTRPWSGQEASEAQRSLMARAAALRDEAAALDPQRAYGPATRIRDNGARRDHQIGQAVAAADIRRDRDRLGREARDAEMQAGSIPQDRHDAAYVTWMLDHVAAVEGYAHLADHPDDYEEMRRVANRVRSSRGVTAEGVRLAARDALDAHCAAAGVPEWRKTYYYRGAL